MPYVEFLGLVTHMEAIGYTKASSLLILLIRDNLDPQEQVVTIPGKFFEYLAAGAPILFIGPLCEVSDILEATGRGRHVESTPAAIASEVRRCFRNEVAARFDEDSVSTFERSHLAGRFAGLLDGAASAQASRTTA
jgi:hypothetical protein